MYMHTLRLRFAYEQLPVNTPLTLISNFKRAGFMVHCNQIARPSFQSSVALLSYKSYAHEASLGYV